MARVRGEIDIKRKSWKKLHLIDDKDARTIRTADSGRLLGLESPVSTMSPQIVVSFLDRRSFSTVGVVQSSRVANYIALFFFVRGFRKHLWIEKEIDSEKQRGEREKGGEWGNTCLTISIGKMGLGPGGSAQQVGREKTKSSTAAKKKSFIFFFSFLSFLFLSLFLLCDWGVC